MTPSATNALFRTWYLYSWISEKLHAGFRRPGDDTANSNMSAIADRNVIDDRRIGSDPHIGANCHAAADDSAGSDARSRSYRDIVGDVNMIVHFHQITENGVVQGRACDSTVGTDFDGVADLDSANMRKCDGTTVGAERKSEAAFTDGGVGLDDAFDSDLHTAGYDNSTADPCTRTDLDGGSNHRTRTDGDAGCNVGVGRYCRAYRDRVFFRSYEIFFQNSGKCNLWMVVKETGA